MGGRKPNILPGAARDGLLERVTRDFTLHDFTLRGLVAATTTDGSNYLANSDYGSA